MICSIEIFLFLTVNWFFVIGTVSESYTRSYNGYTFTYPVLSPYLSKAGAQTWCAQNGSNLLEIKNLITVSDQSLQRTDLTNSFGYISLNPSRTYIVASIPIERRGYICQGKFDCTAGFLINNMCYKSYTSPATTWFNARNRCLNDGGDLASFDFIIDDRGLNNTLNRSWFSSSTTYWIGIRRQWWIWQPSNLEVNYTNWQNGRPVYFLANGCICLTKSGSEWQWIEHDCTSSTPFLCMTEPPITLSTSSLMTQFTNITSTRSINTYSGLSSYTAPYSNLSSSSIKEAPLTSAVLGLAVGLGIAVSIILSMGAIIALMKRKLSYQTRIMANVTTGVVDTKTQNQLDVRRNPQIGADRAFEMTAEQNTSPYESLQQEGSTTDDRHYQELRAAGRRE